MSARSTDIQISNLSLLLQDGHYSDVIVRCGKRTWNCHGAILITRSGYFRKELLGERNVSQPYDSLGFNPYLIGIDPFLKSDDESAGQPRPRPRREIRIDNVSERDVDLLMALLYKRGK